MSEDQEDTYLTQIADLEIRDKIWQEMYEDLQKRYDKLHRRNIKLETRLFDDEIPV